MCPKCNTKNNVPSVTDKYFFRFLNFPFIFVISVYRLFSPIKQFLFGSYARCRFYPTCSEYSLECFRHLPIHLALCKTLSRIAKCNPMHPGGYDPLFPDQEESNPQSSNK
ncbi:MAG: membrane protein insertion efficiency factor YidD [Verrucomicrobiota bacterium]|nr:membrane protein insertion efficiency factor YidD [Opitutae bacterium]MEC7800438.1 membrane protein insertion efficiency factor YidD [Verrucomicrobiota bacterium]